MKLPDGFEGVVLSEQTILLSQLIQRFDKQISMLQPYFTFTANILVPFYYTFTQIRTNVFTFVMYPLMLMTQLIPMFDKSQAYLSSTLQFITTICIYVRGCGNQLLVLAQLGKGGHVVNYMCRFLVLMIGVVSSAFQMALTGSSESGLQIQHSWPFQHADQIFVSFDQMKKDPETFWIRNLTAIANHQWLFALLAGVLSLLNSVMGMIRLCRRMEETGKEVINSNENNLPAFTHNLSNEELEDKLQRVEKKASHEMGQQISEHHDQDEADGISGEDIAQTGQESADVTDKKND